MRGEFRPPRESARLTHCVQQALPLLMRARGIAGITVAEEEWAHLAALRGGRGILAANHPTTNDPLVLFALSHRLGESFNYLACRELFRGPYGWLIQRLGAYSITRGLPDRESLRATRRLLAERDRKVVIFPEAETYEYNDVTIPFYQGPVQAGFWALEDLEKAGREARLPVLPLAVKYRCVGEARTAIEAGLLGLERALALPRAPGATLYARARRVGERVLQAIEREYGVAPGRGASLDARIGALKDLVLERVARETGVLRPADLPLPQQMRALFNAVAQSVDEGKEAPGPYERRQRARRLAAAALCRKDLLRLQNFLAVTDGYVGERMTPERFLDLLGRLEVEVFGAVRTRVPREAIVRLAPTLDLAREYEHYRAQKRQTVEAVTAEVETRIRALLTGLAAASTTLDA